MRFLAEDNTDRWIHEHLQLPEHGFYVDVGCAREDQYSQTAFLRSLGWHGLAIDGNSGYYPTWHGVPNTTFVVAVVSDEPEINWLEEPQNSLVSRKHPEGKRVKCRRLGDILEEHKVEKVDFLAVDVEDHELSVLMSLDLKRHAPTVIVAEYNSQHAGQNFSLLNYLVGVWKYRVVHMTISNAVFYKP